jgi:hypothetical protein
MPSGASTPSLTTISRIAALRRQRWTGAQIAPDTGVSIGTVRNFVRKVGHDGNKGACSCRDAKHLVFPTLSLPADPTLAG